VSPREWSLSVFFAAFIALKIAEAGLGLESWPVSNVSMFSGLHPVELVPLRSRLVVTRGSGWFDLGGADLRLSEDEFVGRLRPDDGLGDRCGRLVDSYNRAVAEPWKRLAAGTAVIEPIPRPGIASDAVGWTVPCVMPRAGPAGGGGP